MKGKLITEKFDSPILAKLAKEHGGVSVSINGGMRDGAKAWYRGNSIDLSSIKDDMLGDVFQYYTGPYTHNDEMTPDQRDNAVIFNDGYAVALKPYSYHKKNGTEEPHDKVSKPSKYGSGIGDTGDHNREPSSFIDDGGKVQGQKYNAYGVSDDAGYANGVRNALSGNKADAEYWDKMVADCEAKADKAREEGNMTMYYAYVRRGNEYRQLARNARGSIANLRNTAKGIVKNHQKHSVKPMPIPENKGKKKLVITQEQFRRLNEADANIVVPFKGNTPQQANAAYQDARNQIDYAKSHASNGDVTVSLQGDNYDENKPSQVATLDPNNPNITTQLDSSLFNANPGVEVKDKEVYEGKVYTKKQLEEARIFNIKKNGKHYTKRKLQEIFGEDDYIDPEELIETLEQIGDFLYVINYFGTWRVSAANASHVQDEIFDDIRSAGYLEYSHDVDDMVEPKVGSDYYVVKLCSLPDQEDYYVVVED